MVSDTFSYPAPSEGERLHESLSMASRNSLLTPIIIGIAVIGYFQRPLFVS
jgi:hypothetical protein